MSLFGDIRDLAGSARRRLQPSPVERARREFEALAARAPRHTRGRVRLLDLDLQFADALSTVPQWDDIFVRESLAFTPQRPSPRILDCGANIGLATLWFKRRFAEARITAFEADPTVAAVLRRNLDVNHIKGVDVVEAALWSSAGPVAFHADGADSGAVDDVSDGAPGPRIEVPAVRLRDWVSGERIDLLKLDVEGAELEVLRDCADVFDHVRAILVEVHDFTPAMRRLPHCLDLLQRAGFHYTLADLHQTTWRSPVPSAGPFAGVAAWVIVVKAWPAVTS
jgi:FkbM family methyltransferase